MNTKRTERRSLSFAPERAFVSGLASERLQIFHQVGLLCAVRLSPCFVSYNPITVSRVTAIQLWKHGRCRRSGGNRTRTEWQMRLVRSAAMHRAQRRVKGQIDVGCRGVLKASLFSTPGPYAWQYGRSYDS
jgi:hypothetical protein